MITMPILSTSQILQVLQIGAIIFFWAWGRHTVNSLLDFVYDAFDEIPKRAKMSALSTLGVEGKQKKKIGKAMLQDLLTQQNPLLGMVLEQFPSVKELLLQHPEYVPMIMQFLGNMNQNPNNGNSPGGGFPLGVGGTSGITTSSPPNPFKFD